MPDGNEYTTTPAVSEEAYTQLQRAYEQLKERMEMAEQLYHAAEEELERRRATASSKQDKMPKIATPKQGVHASMSRVSANAKGRIFRREGQNPLDPIVHAGRGCAQVSRGIFDRRT